MSGLLECKTVELFNVDRHPSEILSRFCAMIDKVAVPSNVFINEGRC